ncbi:MAG TPA: ATPase, T2SS/T4P/T4SS family [Tepidisphaeraceae bacterium]|jgi:type II secretory ATPase GspE/PulE/Tfp pilus assembly ATPase PilB-like protein|nr:ATPase, T2SS/T4P/T4SS family [Tepidisphaeraceae bacterium]
MHLGLFLADISPGGYVSIWKCVPVVIILLIWARLVTWIDKDAEAAHMPRIPINLGMLLAGILAFFLFFFLPMFVLAFPVLVFVIALSIGVYLFMRKQKVGLGDLKKEFSSFLRNLGPKRKIKDAGPGQVTIMNAKGSAMPVPEGETPERAGYDALQTLLTDPLRKKAERVDMIAADGASQMKYVVDGMPYSGGSVARDAATAAVTYLKFAAGLDANEKRKPQTGTAKAAMDGKKHELKIRTAGSSAGESVVVEIDPKARHALRLEELGMPPEQMELLLNPVREGQGGIVLVSAPKTQGLTSLLYAILRAHDAFMTHIHTIERNPDQDLEGITQNKLASSTTPAEEAKQVEWVTSQEPDVLMMSEITDQASARSLLAYANAGKRAYVGIRAGSTFEALEQWQKLVGDPSAAIKPVIMVISGRVMRRLCNACKVGYTPEPTTLRKLNMDPDKISKLFQARTEPLRDQKGNPVACEFCQELHFTGRIGVYEILTVDDEVRQIIKTGGSVNQLKAVFRKQRSKYLQEQALVLVERGDTSIQEVLRVLKAPESSSSSSRPSSKPKPPAKPTSA